MDNPSFSLTDCLREAINQMKSYNTDGFSFYLNPKEFEELGGVNNFMGFTVKCEPSIEQGKFYFGKA